MLNKVENGMVSYIETVASIVGLDSISREFFFCGKGGGGDFCRHSDIPVIWITE